MSRRKCAIGVDFGTESGHAVPVDVATGEEIAAAVYPYSHGMFTTGKTVKDAVMVEDAARTVWLALQLSRPGEIPPGDVAALHRRYTHAYNQAGAAS